MSDTTYKSKVGYKPPVELEYHEGTPEIKSVWDNMRDAEGKILDQVAEHVVAQCSAAVGMKIDREELIKALRCCAENFGCPIECPRYSPADEGVRACVSRLEKDAAAAIEALQAEAQFYKALADEWQASAENKERLLGLYRAEQAKHFYSAIDDNGRIKVNPCACTNIPVFPDSSESPNS